jgi:8-oxo-dGTP pyrophosphatase MutT (NUDIX family)
MEPFPHHGQAMTQAKPYKIPESVLVVIHSADQYVLLIERADQPGFWQSVTGSKDALDEPLSETARREVEEETGIVVADTGVDSLQDGGNRVPRASIPAMSGCRIARRPTAVSRPPMRKRSCSCRAIWRPSQRLARDRHRTRRRERLHR